MIIVKIDIPARGRSLEFTDAASALVWIQDEIHRWSEAFSGEEVSTENAAMAPIRAWKNLHLEIDHYRKRKSRSGSGSGDFNVDQEDLVTLKSSVGQALIFIWRNLGHISAHAAALSNRLGVGDVDWHDDKALKGVLFFDRSIRKYEDLIKEESDREENHKIDSISDRIENVKGSIGRLEEMVNSLAKSVSQQTEGVQAELSVFKLESSAGWKKSFTDAEEASRMIHEMVDTGKSSFDRATNDAAAKIQSWLLSQEEAYQLHAPAKLWADRSSTHGVNSKNLRIWSLFIAVIGLILAVAVAVAVFYGARPLLNSAIVDGVASAETLRPGTLRPTFHFELIFSAAVTVAWLTMYLWVMRILVRLYTTEHHLAIDASARGAMMESYLSLIEADAASPVDRQIVLQALFRPVQDGMIKDDGPPVISPAGMLTSWVSAPQRAV